MSRLFGCVCNEPERLKCALAGAREALVADAAPDGWGLAFFQGGEVLLQRHPKPAGPVDFYAAVRDLRTDYVVGHVRERKAVPKLENTQPYRFRAWVFAHTGPIDRFDAIQAGVLDSIPDFLRRNIRGQTDSEHVFHLFLAFLHDDGKLDDPNLGVTDAQSGLRATAAMLDRLVGAAGGQPSGFNAVLTNGRIMLAVRRGAPMWWRRTDGVLDCPLCREEARLNSDRRRVAHEHLRSVLVASEPRKLGPDGWEEVPDSGILAITRDLKTTVSPLRAE